MGVRSPSPTTRPSAQGSSARKVSPHIFWLQKSAGIELVEEAAGASAQDGRCRYTFYFLTQPRKDNNQLKTNKQTTILPENQTEWKSDNPGVKEQTFIQTGRTGETGS